MSWAEDRLLTLILASIPASAMLVGCPGVLRWQGLGWVIGTLAAWTCASLPLGMLVGLGVLSED